MGLSVAAIDLLATIQGPVLHTADLTVAILVATAVGLLFLGRLFLKGAGGQPSIAEDDAPTTLATRGSFCNVIIGRRIAGPVFAWAGYRITKEESVGSAGGGKGIGGGGGGSVNQTIYFEHGWHVICLGPAGTLYAIYENGKNILPNPISAARTPSGSTVETEVGTFRIYWGEADQPVDPSLPVFLSNIESSWPFLCYVIWIEKRLGTGATWPSLEYDIEALCTQSTPGTYSAVVDDGIGGRGANGAAVLHQLITADWPHGGGGQADILDFSSLESTGLLLEDEGLAMNLLIRDGDNEITKWMQAVMLDAGVMLVDHPDGRLVLMPIRQPQGTLPVVDGNYQTQPEVEVESIPFDDVDQIDRVLFVFKNRELKHRDDTIEFGDDGVAEDNGRYRIEKIRIDTATTQPVARTIANRRAPEALGDLANVKFRVVRGAQLLLPGQVFEDAEGRVVRVLSNKRGVTVPEAVLDCAIDTYGLPALTDTDDVGGPGGAQPAVPDAQFTFFELPASLAGSSSIALGVLRARANRQQAGAQVFVSIDDGANYTLVGSQNASAAGFSLTDPIAASDGPEIIETGPLVVATNPDAGAVLNLASQTSEWQNGKQLCVIEDASGNYEAFFLREIELAPEAIWLSSTAYAVNDYVIPSAPNATGLRYKCVARVGTFLSGAAEPDWPATVGSTFSDNELTWRAEYLQHRLLGMIRARLDTDPIELVAGSKVYVTELSKISPIRDISLFTPGETVCLKTAPRTAGDILNIDNVVAVCKQLTGDAVSVPGFDYLISGDGDLLVTNIGDRLVIPE